jgi:FkbM family methyltransferase
MPSRPTAYQLKRLVLYPRILYGRFRHRGEAWTQVLDVTNYRKDIYRFIGDRMADPSLIHSPGRVGAGLILDVGAFDGEWATEVAERYPDATIYAFELSPPTIDRLRSTLPEDGRIEVFPFGLAGSNRTESISRMGAGSSIHRIGEGDQIDTGTLRDVAEVWRELDLGQVSGMKINIEGGEYELLSRMAETGLLPKVDTYLIQFHEWMRGSHRMRREIRRELAKTHRPTWDYRFIWERWDRIES